MRNSQKVSVRNIKGRFSACNYSTIFSVRVFSNNSPNSTHKHTHKIPSWRWWKKGVKKKKELVAFSYLTRVHLHCPPPPLSLSLSLNSYDWTNFRQSACFDTRVDVRITGLEHIESQESFPSLPLPLSFKNIFLFFLSSFIYLFFWNVKHLFLKALNWITQNTNKWCMEWSIKRGKNPGIYLRWNRQICTTNIIIEPTKHSWYFPQQSSHFRMLIDAIHIS